MLKLNQKVLAEILTAAERQAVTHDVQEFTDKPLTPAGVLVPLIERKVGQDIDYQILLTRRAQHLKHHAGQISFPGGRKEHSDVDLAHTALRETHEEVGIKPDEVKILGQLQPHYTITRYSMTPFIGIIQEDYSVTLDPAEVDEAFEVPLSFALDPVNHKLQDAFFQGKQRSYYSIKYEKYNIWGATARVLVEFSKLIHKHVRPLPITEE